MSQKIAPILGARFTEESEHEKEQLSTVTKLIHSHQPVNWPQVQSDNATGDPPSNRQVRQQAAVAAHHADLGGVSADPLQALGFIGSAAIGPREPPSLPKKKTGLLIKPAKGAGGSRAGLFTAATG